MLVEVGDKVVTTQLFERKFVCDLNACKGACCVKGDAGAPLKRSEIQDIERNLDRIKPHMREAGKAVIQQDGVFYLDQEGEPVTSLVNGEECAFVYFDENNIAKCAIEKAYYAGDSDFLKPVSCHLYPIRVKQFHEVQALNYDEWEVCEPACACGEQLDVPVYKFLKNAITRAFGEEFYRDLDQVAAELRNNPWKGGN